MKVERYEDLEGAMREAFAMKDRLVFMDIYVDPSEHVYPMQVPRGSMRDMWLNKTERT
jgi:acetolactate synthase-1/2/3 large subunit